MAPAPVDPRWPKILSLSVHEFRTPLTVVGGYIRMLLKERGGPLSDQQRHLLEEAEKSCARLSTLLADVSDLSNLEQGNITMNLGTGDLRDLLRTVVGQLPPVPDREMRVDLQIGDGPAPVRADITRLGTALTALLTALRRELVTSDVLIVRERRAAGDGAALFDICIGDAPTLAAIDGCAGDLPVFDEWRGGCGLALPVARRVIEAHGGSIWSAPDDFKAGARLLLPESR
ncbi:MAG TPA: HAMP domain-containing sensor histidine kinase [Vicinamibacterales bacterium]|nr:HAMP domain-containing sensor histidine kinase [Vicinamibacterales bacterium]